MSNTAAFGDPVTGYQYPILTSPYWPGQPVPWSPPHPLETDNSFNISTWQTPTGQGFLSRLAPEGVESSDGRMFNPGAIWTRQPPLPLMFLNKTTGGHQDAVFVGNILRVWRENGWIWGEGVFDSSVEAREALRLVGQGRMNRVSIDTAITEFEFTEDEKLLVHRAELLGATIVPFAAFGDTDIQVVGDGENIEVAPLVASLSKPDNIPLGAFAHIEPNAVTPVTITDEGEIYGHLALWNTCHQGIASSCVKAPRSVTGYAHFLIGQMSGRRVGVITLDTVHASQNLDRAATVRHYADTGTIAAYVTISDGELGPWISGYVEPSLTEEQLRKFKAVGVSGDWRYDPSTHNMELVAILAVPTPGFSVPRYEKEVALVASVKFDTEDCVGCDESEKAAEEVAETLKTADDIAVEVEVPTEPTPEPTPVVIEVPPTPPIVVVDDDDHDDHDDELEALLEAELDAALDKAIESTERQRLEELLNV